MDAGDIYQRLPGLTQEEAAALAYHLAEAVDLLGGNVPDQYGIEASAEFTNMRALDISY